MANELTDSEFGYGCLTSIAITALIMSILVKGYGIGFSFWLALGVWCIIQGIITFILKERHKNQDKIYAEIESEISQAVPNTDSSKELDTLIGLDSVKIEVKKLSDFIRVQQLRKAQGLKSSPINYHCVFTGNPGTGKTTVARLLADIFREIGILKKGHLVETDRSGLVAEYVGHTAIKTNAIIDKALDGVLFIDEAYSLVPGTAGDFGMEAIATLLKRMEDDRDRLIVILAGYGDEMEQFINSNPGLKSRFNRYIHFGDYSADELWQIFELQLKKQEYSIDDAAVQQIKRLIAATLASNDPMFGNARYVRNLFEKILQNQAMRLATEEKTDKESLQRITAADIPCQ